MRGKREVKGERAQISRNENKRDRKNKTEVEE